MKIIRPIRNVVQETSRQGAFTGAVLRKNKVVLNKKLFSFPFLLEHS